MTGRANAAVRAVREAVRARIPLDARVVLAVSGGCDSMVLLDAVGRWRRGAISSVATFDHGTGDAAREASALVVSVAERSGLPAVSGRGAGIKPGEAAWRAARWRFLRDVAASYDARVATAHTRDDQAETVFIRALRDAGPRGLAGLYAESPVLRPLLDVGRAELREYAKVMGVTFVSDPTNLSRRYLRNRVRLDLLPAMERLHPGFSESLLALSRRAAAWRSEVGRMVDALGPRRERGSLFVPAEPLDHFERDALAVLWPEIAARAGVVVDRRGTERLAEFSRGSVRGSRVQLSGGHEVIRHARAFEVRQARPDLSGADA